MRKPAALAVLLACASAFAGSIIPTMAVLVNERDNQKKIDPKSFGYIGLTFTSKFDGIARMDLKNIATGDRVRIWMNPELENSINFSIGPIKIAEKKFEKDVVSKGAIVQQLPPGDYVVSYFYMSAKTSGISLKPDTLHIESGKILSLGNLAAAYEMVPILQVVKSLKVYSASKIPDSLYAPFANMGINTREIPTRDVNWLKD